MGSRLILTEILLDFLFNETLIQALVRSLKAINIFEFVLFNGRLPTTVVKNPCLSITLLNIKRKYWFGY